MIYKFLSNLDINTVLAILTAIVSVWFFLRRYQEESLKTRVAQLEGRSLDQLFHFRKQILTCLDTFEDLPDVHDDETAQVFWTGIRNIRREVRKSINEFALFTNADESNIQLEIFDTADRYCKELYKDLGKQYANYSAANEFKRILYHLLEEVEIKILKIQEIDGRPRTAEVEFFKKKYGRLQKQIDDLTNNSKSN